MYVFFGGDICLTYQFLEDQQLNQERSCEVLKKIIILSDLSPAVRSYPVLRYFLNSFVTGVQNLFNDPGGIFRIA